MSRGNTQLGLASCPEVTQLELVATVKAIPFALMKAGYLLIITMRDTRVDIDMVLHQGMNRCTELISSAP